MYISQFSRSALIAILCIVLSATGTEAATAYAQDGNVEVGTIVYSKLLPNDVIEYLAASQAGTRSFLIPPSQCELVSPSGMQLAIADEASRKLTVILITTGQITLSQMLPNGWSECNFSWTSDGELQRTIQDDVIVQLDVQTGSISTIPGSRSSQTTFLPLKVMFEPAIYSPNGQRVLYNQCVDMQTDSGHRYCTGQSQMVVFNTQTQQILHVLTNAASDILGSTSEEIPYRDASIFWSHTGRYVLYETTQPNVLEIYDLNLDRTIPVVLPNSTSYSAIWNGVTWADNDMRIGLWLFDGMNIAPNLPQRFVYFDLQSETLQTISSTIALRGVQNWTWSPDNTSIAAVSVDQRLLIVELATSTQTSVDQNVNLVLGWE